ncbi:winged helix-turn-helix domain-containing protein [Archaeoglobus profundus]|uniref:Regulatory protein ArsR n=1 Tax=Archaeoglobus profundus (strain DSM 5631 / JCM 9629 / NBRC 100127 / Av18) TaxID=572546 RepID=D2RFX3_ARCPA|nr:winged helix-turn-helix domain-containing protein [Archaeoglobus profundus]ADB57198.1 regulatory protein ArsR [Archaeoglobus profundus DSM 5631]
MVSKRELEILGFIIGGKKYFHAIQEALGLKKPIVSEYLSNLKNKGLIIERQDPNDRRRKLYEINPEEFVFTTVNEIISFIEKYIELTEEEKKELEKVLRHPSAHEYFKKRLELIISSGEKLSVEDEISAFVDGIVAVKLFEEAFKDIYRKFAKDFARELVKGTSVASTSHLLEIAENLPMWFVERWSSLERFRKSAIGQALISILVATRDLLQKKDIIKKKFLKG